MANYSICRPFSYRVSFAARVIASGARTTRHFDSCFEMYDGEAVVAALVRRAKRNPRLAENLPRYLCKQAIAEAETAFPGRSLADVSAEMIAAAMKRYHPATPIAA